MAKLALNKNNEDVKVRLIIACIWDTSERLWRIATKYGLRTAFYSLNTLRRVLCNSVPILSKL